jgi:hypothetical protein
MRMLVQNRRIRENQGCHMYELPSLRGEPLRVAVTEIVRGETLITFYNRGSGSGLHICTGQPCFRGATSLVAFRS